MIQVNYGVMDEGCFTNYLKFLINQLYKSLCMKEEGSGTLMKYLESLNRELAGSKELISYLNNDAKFLSLMSKVQYLISEPNTTHKIFKKEIFACINIVKQLLQMCEGEVN